MKTLSIARACVGVTLLAHVAALLVSGADPAATPISQLSRGDAGWIHTLGLLSLALAWGCLFSPLWRLSGRYLWRSACGLLLASIPVLLYVAFYFATASDSALFGTNANDPLSVLASGLGVAMGAMQPRLRALNRGIAWANGIILFLWLALIPVIPFIEPSWLGTYERGVGGLMLVWTGLLTFVPDHASSDSEGNNPLSG